MALLLLRHALTITNDDGDDDASTYFSAAGFLLPCYIMDWAISILQRRRQRQDVKDVEDLRLKINHLEIKLKEDVKDVEDLRLKINHLEIKLKEDVKDVEDLRLKINHLEIKLKEFVVDLKHAAHFERKEWFQYGYKERMVRLD